MKKSIFSSEPIRPINDTVSTTVTGSSVSEVQAILRPANQTVQPGATVTLDGSQSTGNISSYQWAQTSGTAVTLQGGNSTKATFVAPSSNGDFTSKGELK